MGRQTRFFATQVDWAELLGYVISKGGRLLNRMGEELSLEEAVGFMGAYIAGEYPDLTSLEVWKRLVDSIAISDAVMVYGRTTEGRRYVDQSASEVIEVRVGRKTTPNVDHRPTADPLPTIENAYKSGRLWYEKNGFDLEKTEWYVKPHEKELARLFNSIHRYIRKNYRIDTQKSDYIGPHAYQYYSEGAFFPYSGQYRLYFEENTPSASKESD